MGGRGHRPGRVMSKITVLVVLMLLMACEKTHVSEECKDWRRGYGEELALAMGCPPQEGGFLTKPNSAAPRTARDGPSFTNKTQGLAKCNKAVRVLLGNPLSADFKGLGGMGGVSTRLPGSTPRWMVTSHVDAKNAFGVTKRTAFKCTIKWIEGNRWELIDLSLTDLGVK